MTSDSASLRRLSARINRFLAVIVVFTFLFSARSSASTSHKNYPFEGPYQIFDPTGIQMPFDSQLLIGQNESVYLFFKRYKLFHILWGDTFEPSIMRSENQGAGWEVFNLGFLGFMPENLPVDIDMSVDFLDDQYGNGGVLWARDDYNYFMPINSEGWPIIGEPIRFDDVVGRFPSLKAAGEKFVAVWGNEEGLYTTTTKYSDDGGRTWSDSIILTRKDARSIVRLVERDGVFYLGLVFDKNSEETGMSFYKLSSNMTSWETVNTLLHDIQRGQKTEYDFAVCPDGSLGVVYVKNSDRSGDNFSVYFTMSAGGSQDWRIPYRVSNKDAALANYPKITCDGEGIIHLVWMEPESVYYRSYDPTSLSWTLPLKVNVETGFFNSLSLVSNGDDTYIAWGGTFRYTPSPFYAAKLKKEALDYNQSERESHGHVKITNNPAGPNAKPWFEILSDVSGNAFFGIYTLRGELVYSKRINVKDGDTPPFKWNGRDNKGMTVASGTYLYRVQFKGNDKSSWKETGQIAFVK